MVSVALISGNVVQTKLDDFIFSEREREKKPKQKFLGSGLCGGGQQVLGGV